MIPEPTAQQCNEREKVDLNDGSTGWACWYLQMGGYVGKSVVVRIGSCFEVYVWHDGQFPFGEGSPRQLHHCDGEQFVDFGNFLTELETRGD